MLFKDISYLELMQPFVQWSRTICAMLVEGIMRNNSVKLFEFGPVVQEEMPFENISYLELWRPFCSVERKHVCNILVEGIKRNYSVKLF